MKKSSAVKTTKKSLHAERADITTKVKRQTSERMLFSEVVFNMLLALLVLAALCLCGRPVLSACLGGRLVLRLEKDEPSANPGVVQSIQVPHATSNLEAVRSILIPEGPDKQVKSPVLVGETTTIAGTGHDCTQKCQIVLKDKSLKTTAADQTEKLAQPPQTNQGLHASERKKLEKPSEVLQPKHEAPSNQSDISDDEPDSDDTDGTESRMHPSCQSTLRALPELMHNHQSKHPALSLR